MDSINFDYRGGEDCHYNIDHLAASSASVLYRSEDNLPRVFANDQENYKTVASSVVFGAFADDDSLSLKVYFLGEIINYFLGISPITSLNELYANHEIYVLTYPNPFSDKARIEIVLPEEKSISIVIVDNDGNLVSEIARGKFPAGKHAFTWDGCDDKGSMAKSGLYFYSLQADDYKRIGKLILVR